MDLNKKSLNLANKLCSHLGLQNYTNSLPDIQRMLLTAFVGIYLKARSDQLNKIEYDPATQSNVDNTNA